MRREKIAGLLRAAIEAQNNFVVNDRKLVERRAAIRKDLEAARARHNDLVRQDTEISHESATDRFAMLDAMAAAFPALIELIGDDFGGED